MNKTDILKLSTAIKESLEDDSLTDFTAFYQGFTREMNTNSDGYRYQYLIANLASEAGEVAGLYAKHIRDGTSPIDYRKGLKKELGDIMWHVSELCNEHGWDIEDVILDNVRKLVKRLERGTVKGSGDNR